VDVGSSSLLDYRKILDPHAYVSSMSCINATQRTRFSSLFVAIVEGATAAAIEEAYFWSTTHAEAEARCRFRWRERERDRPSEEKMKKEKEKR
jgi:hypothetical protein